MAPSPHLFRRGAVYVWRRTLPRGFAGFRNRSEFRLSTRSYSLTEAARRARRLDVAFDAILETVGDMLASGLTLTLREVNNIVRAALMRRLDEAEAARALAGIRSPAAAEAAAAEHRARQAAIRQALMTNDLDRLAADWPAARDILAGRSPEDAALLGRALLRGLERGCVIDAQREAGNYDDEALADWAPFPSAGTAAPPVPASTGRAPAGAPPAPRAVPPPVRPAPPAVANDVRVLPSPAAPVPPNRGPAPPPPAPAADAPPRSAASAAAGPLLSQTLAGFLHYLKAKVRADTIVDYEQSVRLFIELMGDLPVTEITASHAFAFREELRRLPSKYGQMREFAGRPLREVIEIADAMDREALKRIDARVASGDILEANRMLEELNAKLPRLTMKAANKHLTALRRLFGYLHQEARLVPKQTPFDDAFYSKKLMGRKPRDERNQWRAEDVRDVLLSPAWTGCHSARFRARPGSALIQDSFYWVWLVLAYQPLRLEEACQLMVDNVVEFDGIHCLQIRGDSTANQHLKNDNAGRLMPIHRILLEAGFLRYAETLRNKGVKALFPELQPRTAARERRLAAGVSVELRQSFGRKFYRKMASYLTSVDKYAPGRVNHALRHTIDTMLHNEDVLTVRISELLGHRRLGGGETTDRYYKGATLAKLKAAIDKIDYGVVVAPDGRFSLPADAPATAGNLVRFPRRA